MPSSTITIFLADDRQKTKHLCLIDDVFYANYERQCSVWNHAGLTGYVSLDLFRCDTSSRWRCACRKCHPCRSGGVVVLVEYAAKVWVAADVETCDLSRIGSW